MSAQHGTDLEKWWQQNLGFGFECLTWSEARYLTTPRMLEPFEIDLLRQDLQAALKLLGQGEIDDAHAPMRDQGFRAVDFAIIRHADPPPGFPSAVTRKMTLVRKSTQVTKTYEADDNWLLMFENDFKHHAFD